MSQFSELYPDKLWAKSFREAFCETFGCPSERYEQALFWRCLYRHALPFAAVLYRVAPDCYREDFELIHEVSPIQDPRVFQLEVDRFHGRTVRDRNWMRSALLIRLSCKRLMRIRRRVFPS